MIKRLIALITLVLSFQLPLHAQDSTKTPEQYLNTYKDLAVAEMKRTGIPASITLAQGLLESGCGNSRLARQANNHFGIKCKSGWTGRTVTEDDDEAQECFRAYDRAEDSYKDHSDFLVCQQRYAFLFKIAPTDYKSWAYGLKQAGYATDPKYPDMLINNIEKYGLYQYDNGNKQVPPPIAILSPKKKEPKHQETSKNFHSEGTHLQYNDIKAYITQAGDNFATVADAHNMMRWEIRKYNDLLSNEELKPGMVIYLKPKHRKAKEEYHTVQAGEGMYYISQLHGIKLRLLYKWNRMAEGQEPAVGEKLSLRHKRETPPNLLPPGTIIIRKGVESQQEIQKEPEPLLNEQPEQKEPPVKTTEPLVSKQPKDSFISIPKNTIESYEGTDSIGRYHIVQDGETIFRLTHEFHVSFDDLVAWNKISGKLTKGQKIYISKPVNFVSKEEAPADTSQKPQPIQKAEFHTVTAGETLYSIARTYQVSVQDLIDRNGLTSNSISIGQKLKIR